MKVWIKVLVVSLIASGAFVAFIAVQLFKPLNIAIVDPRATCPSIEIAAGIELYLERPEHRRQAARMLVHAGRLYDERRTPAPPLVRFIDYYRADLAAERLTDGEMARLLCALPIVDVEGKRLAGVPSVASVILDRSVAELTEVETFLIACGVMNAESGTRRAMVQAADPEAAISALTMVCDAG